MADNTYLTEEDIQRINQVLRNLLKESDAKLVMLINSNGFLIAKQGLDQNYDTTSLSALAAGSFASTKAIAKLIGETEFSTLFHQGKRDNIHISIVDERTIMAIIFEHTTTIGLVRLFAKEASIHLSRFLKDSGKAGKLRQELKLSESTAFFFQELQSGGETKKK